MLNERAARNRARERGHEADTLWNKTVLASGLGLLGLVLLGMLVLYIGVTKFAAGRVIDRPGDQWQRIQVGVGVTPSQTSDRHRIDAAERDWLQSYGWQDQEKEIARIPIDRAIDLTAKVKGRSHE